MAAKKAQGTKRKAPAKKKAPSRRTRVLCISHKEDADGISAAALVRQAVGGDAMLVDYPGQMDALREAASDPKLKSLYICDLGLSRNTQNEFLDIIRALRKSGVSVSYIDHHDIDPKVLAALKRAKVAVVHDVNECASVLVYKTLRRKLGNHATFVAACAAITDYMEDRPLGSELLQMYDRQFAMLSATVLTYNIMGHKKEPEYLLGLVRDLAESKYPHDIEDTYEFARERMARQAELISRARECTKRLKNLAHMEAVDSGAGELVNFVLGLSGRNVGVAYKERVGYDTYAVSIRGSPKCRVHLGKLVNEISTELGGSGGGHDKACGGLIPKPKIKKFISALNKRIGQ